MIRRPVLFKAASVNQLIFVYLLGFALNFTVNFLVIA